MGGFRLISGLILLHGVPRTHERGVKLPAHRAELPGHAVTSRMRAKEVSFILCPLTPLIPLRRDGARSGQRCCRAEAPTFDDPFCKIWGYILR